jgi:hypothetical protein
MLRLRAVDHVICPQLDCQQQTATVHTASGATTLHASIPFLIA